MSRSLLSSKKYYLYTNSVYMKKKYYKNINKTAFIVTYLPAYFLVWMSALFLRIYLPCF